MHKIVAFLNAERCIGIAEGCIGIAEGRIGIAEGCIGIAEGRIGIAEIYSYFQVNRPRGRGTAMLIGVNLSKKEP